MRLEDAFAASHLAAFTSSRLSIRYDAFRLALSAQVAGGSRWPLLRRTRIGLLLSRLRQDASVMVLHEDPMLRLYCSPPCRLFIDQSKTAFAKDLAIFWHKHLA
jgi:hypothetical protein